MNCHDNETLIHAYIDGELGLEEALEIERHLQDCNLCSQAYKDNQRLRSIMKTGSLYFTARPALWKRVRSSVGASKTVSVRRVRPWGWLAIAASLPLVVAAGWGVLSLYTISSREDLVIQDVVSSHIRSLMVAHLADVASSDQHSVKPWFSGKLDFSPPVKDLTARGFTLVGGRIDYLSNRPVAALVYQRRLHVINLFVWPSSQGLTAKVQKSTQRGYRVIHWAQSEMVYWVVSDLNEGELQEFVREIRETNS